MSALASRLDSDGYALLSGVWPQAACVSAGLALDAASVSRAGTRQLLRQAHCRQWAADVHTRLAQAGVLPANAVPVQCTFFEKSDQDNWLVPIHQDLSVPVAAPLAQAGWHGWSFKEGGWFAQPPVAVLAQMLAARLHLDVCGPDDGPLCVVPGTHVQGLIAPEAAAALRPKEVACTAQPGDVLLMRPLLLHASSKARGHSRRRVLHFLFGPPSLPGGLCWPDWAAAAQPA